MKATIRKTDGTMIEAEGTPEEIAKLAGVPATQYVYLPAQPCTLPHYPATWMPLYPQQPFYRPFWGGGVGGGEYSVRAPQALLNLGGLGGSGAFNG